MFSGHALRRMFERQIGKDDVLAVISSGEVIEDYPDDSPYPSCLLLGFVDKRPLHAAIAVNLEGKTCYVITAYPPNPDLWHDFRTRKTS